MSKIDKAIDELVEQGSSGSTNVEIDSFFRWFNSTVRKKSPPEQIELARDLMDQLEKFIDYSKM